MPSITVANLQNKTIPCDDKNETLLDILLHETDWMHACGGKGRCTTCKARILSGMSHLSDVTPHEQRLLNFNKLHTNERLTCQAYVQGNVSLEVPEDTKLPHINYSY